MVKFGRKFFFDKVYTKKNYTMPIIIGIVLIVLIILTFLLTRYFKQNNNLEKDEIKIIVKESLDIELYSEIPSKEDFINKIENIDYKDIEVIFPEELKTIVDTSNCEDKNNQKGCSKTLVTSLGSYNVIIKSDKLPKQENVVKLNVLDKVSPILELKEVTITEGATYKIENFIASCSDNTNALCIYEYVKTDKDENGELIDYSGFKTVGKHTIKIIAKDASGNRSEVKETTLNINKKKNTISTTCKYGNLSYSSAFVIATKIENTKCAISVQEAESVANKAALKHNKKLVTEIQNAYLQKTIDAMNLEGQITYDITYGLVYNSSKKGVVGYYLMSEAKQTVGNKTTTLARYYIDENGNRVWKINTLNLK